eukprot:CAMPEP_0194141842 /NCGR_PEP_ID=MMETSP0152-20130528/11218_1 /TAXON_ID=1049557 /ORGANISM="Thalassiothrix antarctica, Strain L6-D1" /LENGTH=337 /DNA_ID=CAMNT_0038840607 /DNA_START=35 /DNA_END=1048 /DNA_ORIENTATION=-
MTSCCMPSKAVNSELIDLITAAKTAKPIAEDVIDRCNKTEAKSREIIDFASNIKTALNGVDNKLNPSSYVELQKLCQDEDMKSKLTVASEMNDLAIECAEKASELSTTMQQGADSSPEEVKEAFEKSNSVDPEKSNSVDPEKSNSADTELDEEAEVQAFENDVSDLEECIANLESTNVLTAGSQGSSAFDVFDNKLLSSQKLFDRIKELTISIATIAQTFQLDGCCAKAKAAAIAIAEMKKCMQMSKVVSSLADLGQKLIAAILKFINVAWDKLTNSTGEFVAAKKLKNFINVLDPTKAKTNRVQSSKSNEDDQQSASEHGSLVTHEVVEPNYMCCY